MRELYKLVYERRDITKVSIGPGTHKRDLLTLRAYCDFEPWGFASENWDLVWEVSLPLCGGYWQSTTGWRKGKFTGMEFKAETIETAIDKCRLFLINCPKN